MRTRRVTMWLAVAFVWFAMAGTATAETTNSYDSGSTSADPDVSCKDALLMSTSVIAMKCNYTTEYGTVSHSATSIDIDTYAGCNDSGTLEWGKKNLSDDATGLSVGTGSTGNAYTVSATCSGGSSTSLVLDDKFQNSGGKLKTD